MHLDKDLLGIIFVLSLRTLLPSALVFSPKPESRSLASSLFFFSFPAHHAQRTRKVQSWSIGRPVVGLVLPEARLICQPWQLFHISGMQVWENLGRSTARNGLFRFPYPTPSSLKHMRIARHECDNNNNRKKDGVNSSFFRLGLALSPRRLWADRTPRSPWTRFHMPG